MGKKILKSESNWAVEVVSTLLPGNSEMRLRKALGNGIMQEQSYRSHENDRFG